MFSSAGGGAISSTWKDVDIFDNAATPTSNDTYTVAVAGASTSDIITVTGEDVLIDQNTSATATAADHSALWIGNAIVKLEESSGSAGVTANDGVGVLLNDGGVFESTLADYGSSSTTNNETADIQTDISTYNPGVRSSFVCDEDTCGNDGDGDGDPSNDEFVCSVGTNTSTITNSGSGSKFAGRVKADRNSTMESFDVYLTGNANCTVDFYLIEKVGSTYEVIWRNLNVTNVRTTGWLNSGHIGIPVVSGNSYVAWTNTSCTSGSVSNYYEYNSGTTRKNAGFGVIEGYSYISSTSEFAVGAKPAMSTSTTTTFGFYNRYNLNDLDTSSNATCIP